MKDLFMVKGYWEAATHTLPQNTGTPPPSKPDELYSAGHLLSHL